MINTNLSNECEMRRVLAYLVSMRNMTIQDNQLSTLWLNKSVMTKSGCMEEDFCSCLKDVMGVANEKRCCILANNYRLIFLNQTQCYKTQSKLPSMINTTSEQRMWDEKGRPLKVCTLSRVNAEYGYSQQSTLNTMIEQKYDDQIRMRGRRFC